MAGLEIGFGVLVLLGEDATGSVLLGALAFSIGFVALLLGHSELFTEGSLVPVTTVVAGAATWWQLGRLSLGTLVAPLGGWVAPGSSSRRCQLRETTIAGDRVRGVSA